MAEMTDEQKDRRGMRRYDDLIEWREDMKGLEPLPRLASIVTRYPMGTSVGGIQGMLGMGRGQKVRRQIDRMLRDLEAAKFVQLYRAGNNDEVRLWGRPMASAAWRNR